MGLYMEWSTVVDAPVSSLMSLEAFKDWYLGRYPYDHDDLSDRLERVHEYGTSSLEGTTPEDYLSCNRAGEDESYLTKAEIIAQYREDGN